MQTIKVTDNHISELTRMLYKLNEKNLYLYWLVTEQNDDRLLNNMRENMNQVLEHYRKQISRMYMLNVVEQNIINKEDTQLNLVIKSLQSTLNSGKVMDEYIINGLCLSNIDTIFNDYDLDYKLTYNKETEEKIKSNKYLSIGIEYANSFASRVKIKEKILNIV